MARDVDGCIETLGTLAPSIVVPELPSLGDVSIAVAWTEDANPLVRASVESAASLFPRATFVDLPAPEGVGPLFMYEIASVHGELFSENADLYGEDVRLKIERCLAVSDAAAREAERERHTYAERMESLLEGFDLLVTPTLPCVAPAVGAGAPGDLEVREALISRTFPLNVLGWPALALPCGSAEGGLPASLQVAGRTGADGLVLAAGRLLESALGQNVSPQGHPSFE
jgi:Asp-tRNA(Asn)/Glu-tRNA(Gln) amidotransferase A subunit family amidase